MSTKRYAFITGLPRSRTAWLANYLTWGESFCYHDALHHFGYIENFYEMLETTPATVVGHADPANILAWRELHSRFPDATWIVVRRSFEACYQASLRIQPAATVENFKALSDELEKLCEELKPVELRFNQPHLGEAAAAALGLPLNQARAELLEHLQVQIEPTYLRNRINQLQQVAA
jgi:hypothetical protein